MRDKLPAYLIFNRIGKKAVALITNIAKQSGWDQPLAGRRLYKASAMVRAVILYYIKRMRSLDALVSYLKHTPQARRACGFGRYSPSRATLSRFMRYMGYQPFETLFYQLVEHMKKLNLVRGRHLAIDSTHVKAWTKRKSKDKHHQDYKLAKNCDFARLGMTPKGFMPCYRVHIATLTTSEVPVAIEIFPGNIHDRRAFETILKRALPQVDKPVAVSADKGYSSGKNRNLITQAGVACIIRPSNTDLKGRRLVHFIPKGMSVKTYWRVYWRRNAVERSLAKVKDYCNLRRPRVVNEEPVKQHVYLSFICHQLLVLGSHTLGLAKVCYSLFE